MWSTYLNIIRLHFIFSIQAFHKTCGPYHLKVVRNKHVKLSGNLQYQVFYTQDLKIHTVDHHNAVILQHQFKVAM